MEHADVAPADCPTPQYHDTHYYCPGCSFVAADAPVSEAEAQRGRADALHLQLGETLARLAAAEAVVEAAGELEFLDEPCSHLPLEMIDGVMEACDVCALRQALATYRKTTGSQQEEHIR